MKKTMRQRSTLTFVLFFALLIGVLGVVAQAAAPTDHALCAEGGEYCLVCDVAQKVNALPDASAITAENAAAVIQQIHDIDRIKYDMSDAEYEEFAALVETEGYGHVTRYENAIAALQALTGSTHQFAVQKKFDLGGEALSDTSETTATFEIENVDTGVINTLTMFDLGSSTSSLGADFYSMDAEGWTFRYLLPAGTYTIREVGLEQPITVNGTARYFENTRIESGSTVLTEGETADGITLTLGEGEPASVSFYNSAPQTIFVYFHQNHEPYGYISRQEIDGMVTLPDASEVTRDGYVLTAWNTEPDGSGTSYAPGSVQALGQEEIWADGHLYAQWTPAVVYTFYDYDGTSLGTAQGIEGTPSTPALGENPSNEYATYTFKHWKDSEGNTYLTIPAFETYLAQDIYNVTFTAVYDVQHLKELVLEGTVKNSLTSSTLYTEDILQLNTGDGVDIVTEYAITKNDGIAALLLIPEFDASRFSIKAVSVNGQLVYGAGATSTELLSGWTVTVTGTEVPTDTFKILLEQLPKSDATGDAFIQIIYTTNAAVTGEYHFGFVTAYGTDVDGVRSEAYGVLTDDTTARFNEVKISVVDAEVTVVVREDATVTLKNGTVVYDTEAVDVEEDCFALAESITNALLYHYSAYGTTLADGVTVPDWRDYVTITWYDKNGMELGGAPTNVGSYKLGISAAQSEHFNAVAEQIFDVTVMPYTINVSASAAEKTYNAADQTWTESDLTVTDLIAALNGETGYHLAITNATYKNAGTYTITLTFTATENYTFNGTAGDTKVINPDVTMNRLQLSIIAENAWSYYSDALRSLSYLLTNRLEPSADTSFVRTDPNLTITITTDATPTSDVGLYNITLTATEADGLDNYDIFLIHNQASGYAPNGTYEIERKMIDIPDIADLIYTADEQFPTPSSSAYTFVGTSQTNVGDYTLTPVLVSSNYMWYDYRDTANEDMLEYLPLAWRITPAALTVTLPTLEEMHGKTEAEVIDTILNHATAVGLLGTDLLDHVSVTIENADYTDSLLTVGTYAITGADNSENYVVTVTNGSYTVIPYGIGGGDDELTEVVALIVGAIKDYTGSELAWEIGDFTVSGTLGNGVDAASVLTIKAVAAQSYDYVNANGKNDGVWSYYDPATKLYYSVTVEVKDTINYVLYIDALGAAVFEDTVSAEVFIAQATNAWTNGPSVDATDIENFSTEADALFKGAGEVTVTLKDSADNTVTVADLLVGESYTAIFTVAETNNYTGLYYEQSFGLDFAVIPIPEVHLDSESGEVVPYDDFVEITYDGLTHRFVVIPTNAEKYTVTVNTGDDYASWKNADGEYVITISLTDNYQWDTGERGDKSFRLYINKAELTLTADDKEISYRDAAPAWTVTTEGFVNGETYATYQADLDVLSYLSSDYTQGDDATDYAIAFASEAQGELDAILSNYNVSLTDGWLTVNPLLLDYSDIEVRLDNGEWVSWADALANGWSLEYDTLEHTVSVRGVPEDLVATVYYDNGDAKPRSVGWDPENDVVIPYSVQLYFEVKDGLDENNFDRTNEPSDEAELWITQVKITITANDQTVYYTGNAVSLNTTAPTEATITFADPSVSDAVRAEATMYEVYLLNPPYTNVGTYENAIRGRFAGNHVSFEITYVDGTLTIVKEALVWEIELETVDRTYNGTPIAEGDAENRADFFASVKNGMAEHEVTYKFYTHNGETYVELAEAPINANTYYVKAFYDDGIHAPMESDYVEIVIAKITVTVTATAENRNYLQDVVYGNTTSNKSTAVSGDDVQSVTYLFSNNGGTTWHAAPANSWFTVGNYLVKATVNETVNYSGAEHTAAFTVSPATLADAVFTYNLDTATWTAITATTDGEPLNKYGDVTVTYTVGGNTINDFTYKATSTGVHTLVAGIAGNSNFTSSETAMAEVYSITFADAVANHDRNTSEVYDFSTLAPTQYRFGDGAQSATKPTIASPVVIEGYTFDDAWLLNGSAYSFASKITESITLYASWTINTYTVTWTNGETIYTESYAYLDTPVYDAATYGTPSKATDAEWIYSFAGWGETADGAAIVIPPITENEIYHAIFSKEGVTYAVTFMVSTDNGRYATHESVAEAKFGDLLSDLCSLDAVTWFRGDIWYADEARTIPITTVPVGGATVYGAYVFNVGAGDVNADGVITTDDITLYRQWIVGGYEMTAIERGSEWSYMMSGEYDSGKTYFLVRTADPNADTSADIRDVTTVRMALVGGYGYETHTGEDSLAGVTGQAVVAPGKQLSFEIPVELAVKSVSGDTATVSLVSTPAQFVIEVGNLRTANAENPQSDVMLKEWTLKNAEGEEVASETNTAPMSLELYFGAGFSSSMPVFVSFNRNFITADEPYTLILTVQDADGECESQAFTLTFVNY